LYFLISYGNETLMILNKIWTPLWGGKYEHCNL
jgi:hypothetical protein